MDLKVKIGNTEFKNPVWVASGTFGSGKEFEGLTELREIGAVVTKTITLEKREGNRPQRIVETASGLLNSIGLENKGLDHFIEKTYPEAERTGADIIVSIAGSSCDEFLECAEKLSEKVRPKGIELNLSCPNVAHRDTKHKLISQDPVSTENIVKRTRRTTETLLIAKLTPNVTDITEIARAAEAGGADAVALVNTYMGMAVDAFSAKPVLGNVFGGLSGPAIKPLALKSVWDVYNSINIPIIGIGGIMTGEDVAEFILCGADAVQTGTVNLVDPSSHGRILKEFREFLNRKGASSPIELKGKLAAGL
ncbi:MAG: dihydroorotate dehydrogenase [Candidatus Omnitrophica bacterium]|nr:dihydroorotate dehydrogenase [Candidatus Omnitrophota bacterium]